MPPRPKTNPDLNDEIETEYVPRASNAARLPPKAALDRSLVEVLVMIDCGAVGAVLDPVVDEDGVQRVDDDGKPMHAIVERRLIRKERVMMERWCADIMSQPERDHVLIL